MFSRYRWQTYIFDRSAISTAAARAPAEGHAGDIAGAPHSWGGGDRDEGGGREDRGGGGLGLRGGGGETPLEFLLPEEYFVKFHIY